MSFAQYDLHPKLLAGIRDLGFTDPTPVQHEAIPPAIAGKDVLACAMTGSGKTAAFALPILQRLLDRPRGTTRALVLSPTRELAAQIHEHFTELAKHTPVRSAAIFGGVGKSPQERAFRRGVDVIVATPGRLLDHLEQPYATLDGVEVLVLDEADRMLDMGFLPDIRRVLKQLPRQRQTLFFSATMPAPIVKLGREMLRDPVAIDLQRKSVPPSAIEQAVYPVPAEAKARLFVELVRRGEVGSAIVFCRTKHRANRLAEVLEKEGISSTRIHGNRSQNARTEALGGFKAGRYQVLVATDIAARGIDVEALEHVVNFDVPAAPDDYIHRVGRTGRAEATGDALTLVAPGEQGELAAIERAVGKRLPRIQLPDFDYAARPAEPFEIPLAERIAEIRRRKAEDRERARRKAAAKAERVGATPERGRGAGASGRSGGHGRRRGNR
jgi:ATP-dependent RNA helicase RhlE